MSRYTNSNATMGILGFILMVMLAAGLIGGIANWIADDWNKPTIESVVHTRVVVIEFAPGMGTTGTGFLIAPNIVLTAGHVAKTLADTAQVYDYSGNNAKIDSVWYGHYNESLPGGSGTDIGLLYLADTLPGGKTPFPTECRADAFTYGDRLVMVGAHTLVPGFIALPMTVMALFEDYMEFGPKHKPLAIAENFVTAHGSIIPGNSGSAVLNADRELIGVVVRKFPDTNYAHITAGPVVCDVIEQAATYERTPVDAAE